jgi:WD40 repeat protein
MKIEIGTPVVDQIVQNITEKLWQRPELKPARETVKRILTAGEFRQLTTNAFEAFAKKLNDELPEYFDSGFIAMPAVQQILIDYIVSGAPVDIPELMHQYGKRLLNPKEAVETETLLHGYLKTLREEFANHEEYGQLLLTRDVQAILAIVQRLEALLTADKEEKPVEPPFMVETLPFDYIPRGDITEKAVADLLRSDSPIVVLKGAGGFGKTTVAIAVARDERLHRRFKDGVLWTTLGEKPTEEERITKILDLVVQLIDTRPPVQTLEAAKNELRTAIGDRYLLLVVDDAWRRPDLESFLVDAPNAAVLVTTRVRTALPDKTLIHDIDAMQRDQAVKLLAFGLPEEQVAKRYKQLDDLAKRLGEWALMMKLTNGALKSRMSAGNSLDEALKYVEKSLNKRGLSGSFINSEQGRHQSATATLAVSLDLLKPEERTLYNRLAIFPEDVDIPLETLETLWELDDFDTEEFAQRLFDVSLLLRFDLKAKIIRLHDIVRTHLRETEASLLPGLNASFLDRMQTRYEITHCRDLPLDAPYLWQHLATHLIDAGRTDTLRDLLFDFGWMYAKLNATDPAALLADAVTAAKTFPADRELRLIESALRLAQNTLSKDKKQLANQIRGRLWIYKDKPYEYPSITTLWNAVPDIPGTLTLLPTQQFPPMDQAGGALIRTLEGHTSMVLGAVELVDRRFLSWAGNNPLRLWDADGYIQVTLRGHTKRVLGAVQLADMRLLSWSDDHTLRLWSSDGTFITVLEGHSGAVSGALELADRRLLSWSGDHTLRLWDVDGAFITTLEGHTGWVNGALELANRRLVSWSNDGSLILWHADGAHLTGLEAHTLNVRGALELKSRGLLSWSDDHTLCRWDADGHVQVTLRGHTKRVLGAVELTDSRLLSWSDDHTLRLWNSDGSLITVLEGHTGWVRGGLELVDERLFSWSNDGTLRFWAPDGTLLATLEGHTGSVYRAMELTDGRLLSWSEDHTLRLWYAKEQLSPTPRGHTARILGMIALTDKRLLSWAEDHTLRLWNVEGHTLAKLEGHTASVFGAMELADKRMLSWSIDEKLHLWTKDGQALAMVEANVYSSKDREKISTWAQAKGFDISQNFAEELESFRGALRVGSQEIEIYDQNSYAKLTQFIGDVSFDIVSSIDIQLLAFGDDAGRVIFLKVVPPEEE